MEEINVLILALSPFRIVSDNKDVSKNGFLEETENFYPDKTYQNFSFVSQYSMEVIPRFFAEYKNINLSKILYLASDLTLEKKQIKYKDNNNNDVSEEISPEDFFIKRTISNINEIASKNSNIKCINGNCFKRVKTENRLDEAFAELIAELRDLRIASEGKVIRVLLDTHGGFRGTQVILEALMSLMRHEKGIKIDPKDIYATAFLPGECKIIKDSKPFELLDLVSGINEMIYYGRAESLEKYINGRGGGSDLLPHVKKIAEGIQLCNVFTFEEGLNDLTQYNYAPTRSSGNEDPYVTLFYEVLIDSYKNLLRKNDDREVISEIEWCLEKGFFQQILTFIEARMPKSYFDNKWLACDEVLKVLVNSKDKEKMYTDLYNNIVKNNYKKSTGSKFNSNTGVEVTLRKNVSSKKLEELLSLHNKIKDYRNDSNHANKTTYGMEKIKADIEKYIRLYYEIKNGNDHPQFSFEVEDRSQLNGVYKLVTGKIKECGFDFEKLKTILQRDDFVGYIQDYFNTSNTTDTAGTNPSDVESRDDQNNIFEQNTDRERLIGKKGLFTVSEIKNNKKGQKELIGSFTGDGVENEKTYMSKNQYKKIPRDNKKDKMFKVRIEGWSHEKKMYHVSYEGTQ